MIPFNFNLFGPQGMGTSLFGAPQMFNAMPEPGMPATGAPDGVAPPTSLLADMPAPGASPTGLGGADKDFFVPPGSEGAKPPPAGPPVPIPQPSYKPIPPSAASQLPPPATGPGSDRATAATPGPHLPTVGQGGVGPDVPAAAAGPATTGATAPAAGGAAAPADGKKGFDLQGMLERMGQIDLSGGQQQGGLKPASIGSAGQPHRPQGAEQLFQSILEGRAKMMPKVGGVPEIPGVLARLGIGR